MKTKKIVADSMPLALKMVRQQLGENAIIVNTRTVKKGGVFGLFAKQKFEVTAYSLEKERPSVEPKFTLEIKDKPEKLLPNMNKFESKTEGNPSGFHKNPQGLYNYYSKTSSGSEKTEAQTPIKSPEAEKKISSSSMASEKEGPLLDELLQMKKMMMTFMMNGQQEDALPAGMSKWVTRLKKQGVEEEVVSEIVNGILLKYESIVDLSEDIIEQELLTIITEMIEKKLPVSNMVHERTRMINVIGPTGVGKTTSIAKLATEQVLKQKRRVAMITTDVYRIAAVEQLKTYAGILNVPVEVVRTADELGTALKKLEHYDLIYMDTTGRNYKEVEYRESINQFLNHPLESDNYLVLSMTTKFEDMEILLNEFLESPIQKLILTKFDETSSYGSILNIAFKYPYQLSYITNGQSVPEDITTVDATMLARYLLGKEK
ncbi:flagellar biosynthesis protein FlhF [Bacillus sp. SLBN-46]|uniref:flagellar biosynthesis protein FlhF n=1 Tax=Bacillus sp. SLBN-46 TaxID=3042283 RepID=UPI00285A9227|nr:flagellar biosynthesis protein FlhF [Bacillus sp. SLBN-46]MDR6123739.1 flagellar biosynthesis protein FlhF [Bacillus sp. SLBN-46]